MQPRRPGEAEPEQHELTPVGGYETLAGHWVTTRSDEVIGEQSVPLLIEVLTEELPPKSLRRLSEAFGEAVSDGLNALGLLAPDSRGETFATPRRLAVRVSAVPERQPDRIVERRGPAVGFDTFHRFVIEARRPGRQARMIHELTGEESLSKLFRNLINDSCLRNVLFQT